MAKPSGKPGKTTKTTVPSPPGEVVCEPGRHVDCLHARLAAKKGR